jgi:hypothetical protein
MAGKKPPKSEPAAAKAAGWKPPFPGATPPFKQAGKKKAAPKKKGGGK